MTTVATPTPSARPVESADESPNALRCWNIAVGNFLFHYRNAVFPLVFLFIAVALRPRVIGSPGVDRTLALCGGLVALTGQLVRLVTIGYEYIERGGKNKQVYASHLVQGGVYRLTRNPMYLGNGLIAIGMVMVSGTPQGYVLIIPFFLVVYQAIIAAEEAYLSTRFGQGYADYCRTVNRLLPSLRDIPQAFAGLRYDWKRALRKDLSTLAGLCSGLVLLPLWRMYFLEGWASAHAAAPRALAWEAVVGIGYGVLCLLKKRGVLAS